VRGDIGIEFAGKAVADEVQPAFRIKYDLAEREQLGDVLKELKLQQGDLIESEKSRAELARVTKLRYLVVGSISRSGQFVAQARLVDAQTGLIGQTARITAATADELMHRAPQLALQLMMNDKERLEYEQQVAKQTAQDVKPIVEAPLPAPPATPDAD